jgi:hypothetical protein
LKGCCPFHTESSPSFTVYLDRGYAKCYGGSCQYISSDPLRFLAKLANSPPDQILTSIVYQRFGIKITGRIKDEIRKAEEKTKLRENLASVFSHVLCEAINNPSRKEYAYVQPLITWLTERKIPLNLVERLPIGVMPTKGHIYEHIDPEFRSAFPEYFPKTLIGLNPDEIFHFTGAISFHYQPSPGFAGRIKLRRIEDGKSMMWLGTIEEPTGFFGLDLYAGCLGRESNAHIVEGEFDVLSPYIAEIQDSSVPSLVFVGVSGGAIDDVSPLRDIGFHSGTIVGDNDDGGGGFARMALAQSESFPLRIFDWKRTAFAGEEGLDPDKIVRDGKYSEFVDALSIQENLVQRHIWVAERIEAELRLANPDDIALQKDVLARYAPCVHDATDKAVLGDILSSKDLLSDGIIRTLLKVAANQEEYSAAIAQALLQEIEFMLTDGNRVLAFSKARRSSFSFSIVNSKEMAAALGVALRTPIYKWCASRLGEPEWLKNEFVRNQLYARPLTKRKELVLKLFEDALEDIYTPLPSRESLQDRKQGIHYMDAAIKRWDHSPATRHRLYLVNGADIYLGYLDPTRPRVQWERLETPVHETLVFNTDAENVWAPGLDLVALNKPVDITPEEAFEKVLHIVSTGWSFSLDNEAAQFLESQNIAGLVFYVQAATLFNWMVQTFLHADASSGKSALISLFCASDHQSKISLVECSTNYGEWTAAGITQDISGRSMLACIDEFENPNQSDQDEKRKHQVRTLLNMLRQNLVTEIKSVRGTPTGKARSTSFRAPVLAAGIHVFDTSNTNVDLSRWNIVRLHKEVGRVDSPEMRVFASGVSESDIVTLQRQITLLVLQHAAKIKEHYEWCVEEYTQRSPLPRGTDYRMLNIILPIAAILRWAGQDEKTFIADYLRYKVRNMATYYTAGKDAVLHDILSLGRIQVPDDSHAITTPGWMLADLNRRDQINLTHCGVYYITQLKLVVIHCRQALHKLLRYHANYRNSADGQSIRKHLLQNPLALTEEETKQRNVATYLQTYMGVRNIPYRELVAFPIDCLVDYTDEPPPDDTPPESSNP